METAIFLAVVFWVLAALLMLKLDAVIGRVAINWRVLPVMLAVWWVFGIIAVLSRHETGDIIRTGNDYDSVR